MAIEQLINNNAYFNSLNYLNSIGQRFTYVSPITVNAVAIFIRQAVGFPTLGPTEYKCRIRKTSDNSILGTSTNSLVQNSLTTTYTFRPFTFSPVAITEDWYFETYNIGGGDASERYDVGIERPVGAGQAMFDGGDVTNGNVTYKIFGS